MSENSNPNQNPEQDYTVFGGWLLVWYWGLIIGGAIILLSTALPALITIVASFLIGFVYAIGILVSVVSVCISAVLEIQSAIQLKARNSKFFDTFMLGVLISVGGSIISSILTIRSVSGISRFIGSTVGSVISAAICLCLCIMYFSKSVRVSVYFESRPLQNSQFWSLIKLLPDFIDRKSVV